MPKATDDAGPDAGARRGPARSLAKQVTHHRTPEFVGPVRRSAGRPEVRLSDQERRDRADQSGTGAMEAAVVNLVPRGGKAIVLDAGVFARPLGKIAGLRHRSRAARGAVGPRRSSRDDVARLLSRASRRRGRVRHADGEQHRRGHDVQAIGRGRRADSRRCSSSTRISGAGVMECRTDAWGIDVLVVGSQKALMLPPGLAFLAVSEESLAADRQGPSRRRFTST